MYYKIRYCVRRAIQNVRYNPGLSATATCMVTITFVVSLIFLLLVGNLSRIRDTWIENVHVIAFLKPKLSAAATTMVSDRVGALPQVASVTVISPDDAIASLRESMAGQAGLLDGLTDNPLPASLDINLHSQHLTHDGIAACARKIGAMANVAEVEYGRQWLGRFLAIYHITRFAGLTLSLCLLAFTLRIIATAMRLSVYSHLNEIEIMRLVGATALFIRVPFWIEGAMQGLCGSLCAVLLVAGAAWGAAHFAGPNLSVFWGTGVHLSVSSAHAIGAVCAGTLVGLMGSVLSLLTMQEVKR